jgi:cytosine/adenosine deaminase-related metal-dependent hydrolase
MRHFNTMALGTLSVAQAWLGYPAKLYTNVSLVWCREQGVLVDYKPASSADTVIKAVLLPGFINAHAHLGLRLLKHQAPPRPANEGDMTSWLLQVIEHQKSLTSEQQRQGITQQASTMISHGITCIGDISSTGESIPLLTQLGLRGRCYLEWFHPDTQSVKASYLQALLERFEALEETRLVKKGLSPHSPYNVSQLAWQTWLNLVGSSPKGSGYYYQWHWLESEQERAYYEGQGQAIAHLHRQVVGASWPSGWTLEAVQALPTVQTTPSTSSWVHGLEAEPVAVAAILAQQRHLITCPRSNQYLHGKRLSLSPACLQLPAIGTDSLLSLPLGSTLSLQAELALLANTYDWLTAQQLLAMATIEGAKALGLDCLTGSLCKGKAFDATLWMIPNSNATHFATQPDVVLKTLLTDDRYRPASVWCQGANLLPQIEQGGY